MATVNFLYRSVKANSNLTIRFLYRDNNTFSIIKGKELPYKDFTLTAKTQLEVTKDFWSNKDKRNATAEIKKLKPTIDKEILKIETYLLNSYNRDKKITGITKEWLTKEIETYYNPNKLPIESYYIKYWIDNIIKTAPKRTNAKGGIGLSYNTIKGYKDIKNVINRYQTLENTKVISLTKSWFINFFDWLVYEENYSHNTAVKKISILKAVINEASKKIEVPNDLDSLNIKTIKTHDEDTDVITLTLEDLSKIESVKLESLALDNARKYLIIACYTGQRGSALTERITASNFIEKKGVYRIEIKQIKGSKKVIIPVLPKVLEIYKKGLPYKVSTQKLNKHFKEICKLAGVNEMIVGKLRNKKTNRNEKKERPKYKYISSHVGRRTFATIHFNKLPTSVIMKVTGHSKVSTFMKYIQKDTDEHIDVFENYYKELEKESKPTKLKVIKNVSNQN